MKRAAVRLAWILPATLVAAAVAPPIPWTELTDTDWLTALAVRTASVDGRSIRYPTPPGELVPALQEKTRDADAAVALVALRHLVDARLAAGDPAGAAAALEEWASRAATGDAWNEAARWSIARRDAPRALRAAARALALPATDDWADGARRSLAADRVAWALSAPGSADVFALRAERARLFPDDVAATEAWIRGLEAGGRPKEAEGALEGSGLPLERRTLLLAELRRGRRDAEGAHAVLEAWVADPAHEVSADAARAFSESAFATKKESLAAWRKAVDERFDARALRLLFFRFEGAGRGGDALELLRQADRRHAATLPREGRLLLSSLAARLDAVPEAFRWRLAAGSGATKGEQEDDLASLVELALRAGARPLGWGVQNDEPYRWAARVDVTPGFLTGGLSLLLTGFEGANALAELEARRLPDRTFAVALLLHGELARRNPKHAALPGLAVALMNRHVDRGEGKAALDLLPRAETGSPETRARARVAALRAARLERIPLERESGLHRERLRLLAPDGARPALDTRTPDGDDYASALREALARLDARDGSHRASLTLLLGEMDRLPRAEAVWTFAADRIGGWRLDDDLEPRYRAARETFGGPGWWNRLARWYARREKGRELRALADDVVARFRGADLVARDPGGAAVVPIEDQPNPYVLVSDYLRLAALRRFPWSPQVLQRAETSLLTRAAYDREIAHRRDVSKRAVLPDDVLAARRSAVLYADGARRQGLLDAWMKEGRLEAVLLDLERRPDRTPVEHRFLVDGWTRLSRFERSVPFADALSDAYPGDTGLALEAMSLHRSLSGLDPRHAESVARVARRALPSALDPSVVLTPLGETFQELDRPAPAGDAWRELLASAPDDPGRVLEVATLFWDYGRPADGLAALEAGRARLGRPRLHAFEAGVLREEVRDLAGAVDEYVAAARGESPLAAHGWLRGDDRAVTRLARFAGRQKGLALLEGRVERLRPGNADDEETLVALLPLIGRDSGEPSPWDDWVDTAADPVGRERRARAVEAAKPSERAGLERAGARLVAKAFAFIPDATGPAFLAALRVRSSELSDARWSDDPLSTVDLEGRLLAREAALAPDAETRLVKRVARARWLLARGRGDEVRKDLPALAGQARALPEEGARIRNLAALARLAEEAGGDAAAAWRDLGVSFPWSLGVLEDRVDFLFRTSENAAALDLLEKSAATAAAGHRERLTERVAKESLDRTDLPRAKRALETLLSLSLDDARRVSVAGLLARVSYRETPEFDGAVLGKAEEAKLPEDLRPDVWAAIAIAARDEGRLAAAVDLFVESLNRRLDRTRLDQACRLAARAGRSGHLLKFFDAQRRRSPRDVRWAVAVRELKAHAADLPGAIDAANEAVLVAPERESLQREAVALYERAGRFHDAAEFLATWQAPRPADEGVASWRAALYVRAGEFARAIEVERESAAAAERAAVGRGDAKTGKREKLERTARAARRFLALNRADSAWAIAAPGDDARTLARLPLSVAEKTETALRSGHLLKLLPDLDRDASFRSQAADVVKRLARPEQAAALENALLARVFPAAKPKDEAALLRYWGFAERAGLHRFGEAIARRLVAERPSRPWGEDPPLSFVRSLSPVTWRTGDDGVSRPSFANDDFLSEWCAWLVARDRGTELAAVLAPLVAQIDARLLSVPGAAAELPFARWFPVEAFARLAAETGHESFRESVARWYASDGARAAYRAATGSRFAERPLLDLLPEAERNGWLARLSVPASPGDPVLARRRDVEARVATALGSLLDGRSGAPGDPDVVRLRGPRTVGDVLGSDPRFVWSELAPRAHGETGDDAIQGTRLDAGRLPGRLWGARPGEAWYVLEAVARLATGDAAAPWVPLEAAPRGGETARGLLAVRSAQALGDVPLALSLHERLVADLARHEALERRLRLLVAAGRRADAASLLSDRIRAEQATADATTFLGREALARDLELGPPLDALDPARPVSPSLLALLVDREPATRVAALVTTDVPQFRAALAARWNAVGGALPVDKAAAYLDLLWAEGAAAYPAAIAGKLGPWWTKAEGFLAPLDPKQRRDALAAVRALPDPAPLATFLATRLDRRDAARLLLVRARLAAKDDPAALALLDEALADGAGGAPIEWVEGVARPPAEEPGADEMDGESAAPPPPASTDDSGRLSLWLAAFRESGRADAVRAAEEKLRARLARDGGDGRTSLSTWSLAIDLATTPVARASVLQDLERAWSRGDGFADGERASVARLLMAAREAEAAARWVARLDDPASLFAAESKSALLGGLKDPAGARRALVDASRLLPLTREEERRAFDGWRRLAPPRADEAPAPAAWRTAREFWNRKGPDLESWGDALEARLRKQPYDDLSARVVLRSLAPARESRIEPALAALGAHDDVAYFRMARAEGPRSPRAARALLGGLTPDARSLARRRYPRAEIDALLADTARIAAGAGEAALLQTCLTQLEERRAAASPALRAELAGAIARLVPRPDAARTRGRELTLLRPRDLTWDVYARVLDAREATR